ncbi:MAG: hypothetical protein ACJASB_003502 [Shewanella psychromarinicola]|jgi:hypothetical protein
MDAIFGNHNGNNIGDNNDDEADNDFGLNYWGLY